MGINRSVLVGAGLGMVPMLVWAQASSPVFTTLHSFQGPDGAVPNGLIIGSTAGTQTILYGTTGGGGSAGAGNVYSLASPAIAGGAWVQTVLYNFLGGTDGSAPSASLLMGSGGVLYGPTYFGGNHNNNNGTVFSLTPPATPGGSWTEAILFDFPDARKTGFGPSAPLTAGSGGALYGTTLGGGPSNNGVVFSLHPPATAGSAWTETILHNFAGNLDGTLPGGLVPGKGGVLYGTTGLGGTANFGTVYVLRPPSTPGGAWSKKTLYSFRGSPGDGASPNGVVLGPGGVLYGSTIIGGSCQVLRNGCGTVFSLTPPKTAGGSWTEAILYSLQGGKRDGENPAANVTLSGTGANGLPIIYGNTSGGGANNFGIIYSLTPPAVAGGAWTETILYTFTGGSDSWAPNSTMVMGPGPVLYGTTSPFQFPGTVFSLVP